MKYLRLFILLTTLALSRPSLAQLQKQAQLSRFFDALNSGRFSELGQIYAPTDSVAPSVKLAIQAFTEVGKNRYDLAIDLLYKNLRTNWRLYGDEALSFSNLLMNLYVAERRYDDAECQYDWLKNTYAPAQLQYYQNLTLNNAVSKCIEETYKFLEENRKIPQMRIVCKGEPKPIKFILDSHIKTRLKINQTSEMFLWDTGSEGALLIPHRYADALGLDYRNKSVNSKDAQDPLIIVDSLIIGNFTLYNVPAFIHDMVNPIPALYDRRSSEKELHDALMVYEASNIPIIGLPVIKHLEKLGIDWKNNCFFFPKKTLPAPTLQEQMFVTGVKYSKLITPFSINSVRALAMIDIGSTTFADMHKNLVNAYPKRFSTIKDVNAHSYSLTLYGVSDTTNVFLVKPSLTYANQLLLPKERLKVIGYRDEDQDMKSWDVQLGYPFFKSLGEVMVLDFKEMKLKIWRKSDAIHLH